MSLTYAGPKTLLTRAAVRIHRSVKSNGAAEYFHATKNTQRGEAYCFADKTEKYMILDQIIKGKRALNVLFAFALLFASLARAASVLYSLTSTDVMYIDTILPRFLGIADAAFGSVSHGLCFGMIVCSFYFATPIADKKGRPRSSPLSARALVLSLACFAFAQFSGLLIDLICGDIAGRELEGVLYSIVIVTALFLLSLPVYFIAKKYSRRYSESGGAMRNYSPYAAVVTGVLAAFIVYMIVEAVNILQFFIECDWFVYPEEIASMLAELGGIIVMQLIIPIAAAFCATRSLVGRRRETE